MDGDFDCHGNLQPGTLVTAVMRLPFRKQNMSLLKTMIYFSKLHSHGVPQSRSSMFPVPW